MDGVKRKGPKQKPQQNKHRWPKAHSRRFWMKRQNHNRRRGHRLMTGIRLQTEAFSKSFWLFWVWRPGLLCKQRRTDGKTSLDGSVTFGSSTTKVDRMENAKTDCGKVFATVGDRIREVEVNYAEVDGQLKDFKTSLDRMGTLLATDEDSDSDESIEDPRYNVYCWKCAFCPDELNTRAALKIHVEAEHQDLFVHICGQCNFHAKEPGQLREHIISDRRYALRETTAAIVDL